VWSHRLVPSFSFPLRCVLSSLCWLLPPPPLFTDHPTFQSSPPHDELIRAVTVFPGQAPLFYRLLRFFLFWHPQCPPMPTSGSVGGFFRPALLLVFHVTSEFVMIKTPWILFVFFLPPFFFCPVPVFSKTAGPSPLRCLFFIFCVGPQQSQVTLSSMLHFFNPDLFLGPSCFHPSFDIPLSLYFFPITVP